MMAAESDPSVQAFNARRGERAARFRARARERAVAPEHTDVPEPAATPEPAMSQDAAAPSRPVAAKPIRARKPKRLVFAALTGVAALTLSSCGLSKGLYGVPLPGGADLGDDPMTLHVRMDNVYDLVPQAAVKFHNVTIGKVTDIQLANKQSGKWQADVTIQTNRSQTKLPGNAMGSLRQTSLLGEKFVQLVAPQGGAGQLQDNARMQEDPSVQHVEVEQIFGSLSLLLNNGGLPQIRTISKELSNAMNGREGDIKGLLRNVTKLVSTLDAHSDDITKAIDNVNKLSGTLNAQKDRLTGAMDDLRPGLKVLRDQRGQLVEMLKSMQRLSGVTVDTINKSRDDLIGNMVALEPSLRKLADTGDNLADSLPLLATIPFGDYAAKTLQGDYANLYANLDLDLSHVIKNLGRSRQNFIDQIGLLPPGQSSNQPGTPDSSTGSGVYPNDPSYGKPPQGQQAQSNSNQQEQAPGSEVGPNAPPSGGSGGGLGGIFGTLTGGGA